MEQIRIKSEEQIQLNKIAKRQSEVNQNIYNLNENNSFGIKNNFANNLIHSNNYQSQKESMNDYYNRINQKISYNFNNNSYCFNNNTNNYNINTSNFNNNNNNFNNNNNNFNSDTNNFNYDNNTFNNNINHFNNNMSNSNNKPKSTYEEVKSYFKPILYDDTKSDYTYHPQINENSRRIVKELKKNNMQNKDVSIRNTNTISSSTSSRPIQLILYDDAKRKEDSLKKKYNDISKNIELNANKRKMNKKSYTFALQQIHNKIKTAVKNNENQKRHCTEIVKLIQPRIVSRLQSYD